VWFILSDLTKTPPSNKAPRHRHRHHHRHHHPVQQAVLHRLPTKHTRQQIPQNTSNPKTPNPNSLLKGKAGAGGGVVSFFTAPQHQTLNFQFQHKKTLNKFLIISLSLLNPRSFSLAFCLLKKL
jgi:hypothetical protein